VKFLVDNQLPSTLVAFLRKKGFDCEHVLHVGLAQASDFELCEFAAATGRVIISKDGDFLYLASKGTARFQLLWVRLGNCRTATLIQAFERAWSKIEASLEAGERVVEIR